MANSEIFGFDNRDEAKKKLLQKLGKDENVISCDVQLLKKWLENQKHLPEIPSDTIIETFLILNKFSIEKTKQKIDMYYTIRNVLSEMYENKNPKLPHMKKIAKVVLSVPLPKLTDDFNRVLIFKIVGPPSEFEAFDFFPHTFNQAEIRIRNDIVNEDILVYDLENFKGGHLTKMSPKAVKYASTILEKVYVTRVAGIHLINVPSIIDKLLNIVKPLLTEKLRNRIHVHKNIEDIFQYIPKDLLPKDYGGSQLSLLELHEKWEKRMEDSVELFDHLDTLKVNENLREKPLENDDILGYYGSFKTMQID